MKLTRGENRKIINNVDKMINSIKKSTGYYKNTKSRQASIDKNI